MKHAIIMVCMGCFFMLVILWNMMLLPDAVHLN